MKRLQLFTAASMTVATMPNKIGWWDASELTGADTDPIDTLPDLSGNNRDFTRADPSDHCRILAGDQISSGGGSNWWLELRDGSEAHPGVTVLETIFLGTDSGDGFCPKIDITRAFEFWAVPRLGTLGGPTGGDIHSVHSTESICPTLSSPGQNSLNTLIFPSGSSMRAITATDMGITNTGTLFLALAQIADSGPIFNIDNPHNSNRIAFAFNNGVGSVAMVWGDAGGGGIKTLVGTPVNTAFKLITLRRNGNAFQMWVDGVSFWTPTDFTDAFAFVPVVGQFMHLGVSSQALGTMKQFELGEIVVSTTALSDIARAQIEAEMMAKWGL